MAQFFDKHNKEVLAGLKRNYEFGLAPAGFACDIDGILTNTPQHSIKKVMDKFGNPERLSPEEMFKKYGYGTEPTPTYWNKEKVHTFLYQILFNNEEQRIIPVKLGVPQIIWSIHQHRVPFVAYITGRPVDVLEGTKGFLSDHGYPDLPIIARPNTVPFNFIEEWKSSILHDMFPSILGIVDDSMRLSETIHYEYKGTVYLVTERNFVSNKTCVVHCPSMSELFKCFEKEIFLRNCSLFMRQATL